MKLARSIIALLFVAGLCMAQTGSTATSSNRLITTGSSAGLITTSERLIWNGTSFSTCSNCISWASANGIPSETRKDDGRGPTLTIVKASAVKIAQRQLAPKNYIALAKSIGLDPGPATDEARMLQVIHEHEFTVYDYAKVDDYLYRKALKMAAYTRWVWKPMREIDLKALPPEATYRTMPGAGFVYPKTYGHTIPMRVLEDVACVLRDMPNALLLISDYEQIRPDPFLAITTPKLLESGKLWIIAQWDEPGFEDRPAAVARLQ